MTLNIGGVDLLSVAAAAVAGMAIGFAWYSPMLFGNMWMKELGMSKKDMEKKKKSMTYNFGIMFVAVLLMAYVLAYTIKLMGTPTIVNGLTAGFWLWLGFGATISATSFLFEGRTFKFYLINAAHHLAVFLAMGAILGMWP